MSMKILLARFAAVVLALATAGCASYSTSQSPSQLIAVGPPEVHADAAGTLWLWQSTVGIDGAGRGPSSPHRYTLRFQDDGRLQVRADCNRGTGKWIAHPDGVIIIGAFTLSKTACGKDSLDRVFLDGLTRVNRFTIVYPDQLQLSLPHAAGTMTFRALGPNPFAND
jgi:heat shock protein HslJ